jgi:hypothetical protein
MFLNGTDFGPYIKLSKINGDSARQAMPVKHLQLRQSLSNTTARRPVPVSLLSLDLLSMLT